MYHSPFKEKARQTTPFMKKGDWAAGYHTGEDWVCDSDKTLVSPASGTITRNGFEEKGYGNFIVILTSDNKSLLIGHMLHRSKKQIGEKVNFGEAVGTMGNSGRSFGAHLHIEVQNSAQWAYNKNLLKPSDYIDFTNYNFKETENFDMSKVWKNGSTPEDVFAESSMGTKIGSLSPHETCDCIGVANSMYIVKYLLDGTNNYKVGFVKYSGGVE